MKKLIISSLFAFMILSTQQLWAQGPPPERIDQLKTDLELTDDQVTQLENIFEARHEEMMTMRSAEDKTREEKREAMQSFHQSVEKEIESVLNENQLAKFQEIKKEVKGRHGMRGGKMRFHKYLKEGKGEVLHAQIKAYKDENIKPVMQTQRAKLEPKISEADKQILAEFRIEFEKIKAESLTRLKEMKQMRENGEPVDFRGMHKERMQMIDLVKKEKMKDLIEKYKDDIDPLFAEVADQQETWKNDIKEIVKNTLELEDDEMEKGSEIFRRFRGERMEMMKIARFLLLDPNEIGNVPNGQSLVTEVSAYPNPATSITTIEYEIVEEGQVLIELRGRKGNLLKTVKNELQLEGNHSVTISLENYKTELFHIVITDKNGVSTTKNIVRVR
jgi:hypothetical protein